MLAAVSAVKNYLQKTTQSLTGVIEVQLTPNAWLPAAGALLLTLADSSRRPPLQAARARRLSPHASRHSNNKPKLRRITNNSVNRENRRKCPNTVLTQVISAEPRLTAHPKQP